MWRMYIFLHLWNTNNNNNKNDEQKIGYRVSGVNLRIYDHLFGKAISGSRFSFPLLRK